MCTNARPRLVPSLAGIALILLVTAGASAQLTTEGFVTGAAAAAWEKWQGAMQAVLNREADKAEAAFGDLLALDPSPLRVALVADRTVNQTNLGGAVLLFEQDLESDALKPNGKKIAELMLVGKEQMNQADDGWYFASIGRFDVADANFRALLASEPDPVGLLDFADRTQKRRDLLLLLSNNPVMGGSARKILRTLNRGEIAIKSDPTRIKEHIERLGGPPRAFENAVSALLDSGEYAVPFIVQYLRNQAKKELTPAILRALPKIDRPALNPLVMALRTEDQTTKRYIIQALGQIGYSQAVPYLLALAANPKTPAEVRDVVAAALDAIHKRGESVDVNQSPAQAFYRLAEDYYRDLPSLVADPRLETANVWYWRDDLLQNIEVPTVVFNEIMAMRCCEEALRLDPTYKDAQALWIAANFRREAQLPEGETDRTRPADFPPGAYFAQTQGAEIDLMALARAVADADPAVALGTIEALRKTAGPASLLGDAQGRLPLAEALAFPDRMVRIQAALALGGAAPTKPFQGYQNLMPVLSEALMQHGGARYALVVDPDSTSANLLAGALRAAGFEVLTDASLFNGIEKARTQLPGVDVILLASAVREPALAAGLESLRKEFRFAYVPVVVVASPGDRASVRELTRKDSRLGMLLAGAGPDEVLAAVEKVSRAVGVRPITPDVGTALAQQSAEVLRYLAETDNPVFRVADAEPALLAALKSPDGTLRLTIAQVLGFLGTQTAQEAVAAIALSKDEPQDMRVAMFASLAEAAKRRGNHLGAEVVKQIVTIAESDPDMTIRQAASQTLGALNLPGGPASQIIRNQYGG